MSGFTLTLQDTNMTVFKVDGGNDVDDSPAFSSVGMLYPGERIDMIAECDDIAESESFLVVLLDQEYYLAPNNRIFTDFPIGTTPLKIRL
jgi:hypothetical protein